MSAESESQIGADVHNFFVCKRHQPDIYVNGGLLNRVYFTLVKQLGFEANLVFSPRTHKCRVGAVKSEKAVRASFGYGSLRAPAVLDSITLSKLV